MTDNSKRNKRVFLPGFRTTFEFILFKEVNKVQTLFDSFDISIAQVAYDFTDDRLHYTSLAAEDLTFSQFRLVSVNCTLGKQMQRVDRYRQKGYTIHESVWDVLKDASYKTDKELNTAFSEGYMADPRQPAPVANPVFGAVGAPVAGFWNEVPPPPPRQIDGQERRNHVMNMAAIDAQLRNVGAAQQFHMEFDDGVLRLADNW